MGDFNNRNGIKMYDKQLRQISETGCALSSDGKLRSTGFLNISPATLKKLKKNKEVPQAVKGCCNGSGINNSTNGVPDNSIDGTVEEVTEVL